jgi:hypothetical protein
VVWEEKIQNLINNIKNLKKINDTKRKKLHELESKLLKYYKITKYNYNYMQGLSQEEIKTKIHL